MASPRLCDTHARTARELRRQVDEAARDTAIPTVRLLDRRELRGWPAVGRVAGIIVGELVPGSDDHLDRL
jgi:hypothetical protein